MFVANKPPKLDECFEHTLALKKGSKLTLKGVKPRERCTKLVHFFKYQFHIDRRALSVVKFCANIYMKFFNNM